eukprot:5396474-Prymnesium_polylepis.1
MTRLHKSFPTLTCSTLLNVGWAVPRVPLGSAARETDDEHGVPGGRPHGQRRGRPRLYDNFDYKR